MEDEEQGRARGIEAHQLTAQAQAGQNRQPDEAVNSDATQIAADVLVRSRNALMIGYRFLDRALFKMPHKADTRFSPIGTDGRNLYFNTMKVLRRYRKAPQEVTRDYLHTVFHCIFHHPFKKQVDEPELWDMACDIAVESVIIELCGMKYRSAADKVRSTTIDGIREEVGTITAERVYRMLLNDEDILKRMAQLAYFRRDDHRSWPVYHAEADTEKQEGEIDVTADEVGYEGDENYIQEGEGNYEGEGESEGKNETQREAPSQKDAKKEREASSAGTGEHDLEQGLSGTGAGDEWKEISERVQVDLESYSKQWGDKAGMLVANLRLANRRRYNYVDFLRRFAVLGEELKLNDDEFDYIFYTLGLELYGNMPLIEPLEYKDVKRVREFVIALDTSESCSGKLVKSFVAKTYDILMQSEGYHERVNIHIIQCDAEIQEDKVVHSMADLDGFLDDFEVKGYGGTDFRPVFEYVDTLTENGEFYNLRGLIYFTDGYGKFPESKPDYDTVFVFMDDGYNNLNVPVWAMKLIMTEEEIEEESRAR